MTDMQEPSIFTRIINGDLPSHKVYEDDTTLAFLDVHPTQPGHTLVIPKKQVEFIWNLDTADYDQLMRSVQTIGRHIRDVLGVPYVGVKVEGVDVPHAHVHLIPFSTPQEFSASADMTIEPDHEFLAAMAEKLRF